MAVTSSPSPTPTATCCSSHSELERSSSDEGILELRLNSRDGRNGLSAGMATELARSLRGLSPEVRCVILCGSDSTFCTGASHSLLREIREGRVSPEELEITRAVLEARVPVIAAAAGHAVGGGLVLVAACDLIVLARESRYGANFIDFGLTPGLGATSLLAHAFSPGIANELLLTGGTRRGTWFEQRCSLNAVVEREQVTAHARRLARAIADKPARAVSLLKQTLSATKLADFETSRQTESAMQRAVLDDIECRDELERAIATEAPSAIVEQRARR